MRFEFTQEQAVGNCAYYTFGITPVVESMELGTVSVNGGFATRMLFLNSSMHWSFCCISSINTDIDPQNISASTSVLFTRKSSPAFLRLLVEVKFIKWNGILHSYIHFSSVA